LRKPTPSIVPTAPAPARIAAATDLIEVEDVEEPAGERAAEPEPREKPIEVRAPLVGIFRASMKHDGAPLVRKGDMVRAGQVVGAIEALNVPNEVEVAAAGRVQELLVEDGEPVEYGQPLLLIAPATTISS
jgi:acetyl-CoA carboxylase biotin carboxyl carrier protein